MLDTKIGTWWEMKAVMKKGVGTPSRQLSE